jgi:hypothetical protein
MSCSERPQLWNASAVNNRNYKFADGTVIQGTAEDCTRYVREKFGEGVAGFFQKTLGTKGHCYAPCPDASCMSFDPNDETKQVLQCRPRPLLTAIDVYYKVLQDATSTCTQVSDAYRKAVEENGGDASTIGFNSSCPNPYAPAVVPDPTGQGNEGVFDPSASNGDPLKPQDAPPIDPTTPFIPSIPTASIQHDPIASDTSPPNTELPTSRITLTDDEISQFPKVNDYGTMREDTLAQLCRLQPTYCDVNTEYLEDCMNHIKDFTYRVEITQEQYDKLPDALQCLLSENFNDIYSKPITIKKIRDYIPSLTITRDAPSIEVPVYKNTPRERREQQCTEQSVDGKPCSYSGGCLGNCNCPNSDNPEDEPPPPAPPPPPDWFPKPSGTTILLVAGGLMVVGVIGWKIFQVASPTGRALAMAEGNFGTSTKGLGIGGFKLVPN